MHAPSQGMHPNAMAVQRGDTFNPCYLPEELSRLDERGVEPLFKAKAIAAWTSVSRGCKTPSLHKILHAKAKHANCMLCTKHHWNHWSTSEGWQLPGAPSHQAPMHQLPMHHGPNGHTQGARMHPLPPPPPTCFHMLGCVPCSFGFRHLPWMFVRSTVFIPSDCYMISPPGPVTPRPRPRKLRDHFSNGHTHVSKPALNFNATRPTSAWPSAARACAWWDFLPGRTRI